MRLPAAVPMPTPRSLQASTSLAGVQPGLVTSKKTRLVSMRGTSIFRPLMWRCLPKDGGHCRGPREPVPVMFQRIERGCGDDTGTAASSHPASASDARLVMNSFDPARLRTDRCAEALGVVEPQRVDAGGVVAGLGARLDDRIAETRPVHMQAEAGLARDLRHALHGGKRPYGAAAAVRRGSRSTQAATAARCGCWDRGSLP